MRFLLFALLVILFAFSFVSADIKCSVCDQLTTSECLDILTSYVTSIRSSESKFYLYTKMFGECEETKGVCMSKFQLEYQQLSDKEKRVLLKTACYGGYISNAQKGMTLEDEVVEDEVVEEEEVESIAISSSCPTECTSYKCQSDLRASLSLTSFDDKLAIYKDSVSASDAACAEGLSDMECFEQVNAAFQKMSSEDQVNAMLKACNAGTFNFLISSPIDLMAMMGEEDLDSEEEESSCSVCSSLSDKECLAELDTMVSSLSDKDRLTFEKELFNEDEESYCDSLTDKECLSTLDSMYDELSDKTKLADLTASCSSLLSYTSSSSTDKKTDLASTDASNSNSLEHGLIASFFVALGAFTVGILYHKVKDGSYQRLA